MSNKIFKFSEISEEVSYIDIKEDIQNIRKYVLKNNEDGSSDYQQTLTKLNRIEQFVIDNKLSY
jgi:uncharacterized protein YecA (UPF0149 family)